MLQWFDRLTNQKSAFSKLSLKAEVFRDNHILFIFFLKTQFSRIRIVIPMKKQELANYIDQTLLSPTTTEAQMKPFIEQAKEYGFMSVCVNQEFVPLAHEILKDSKTKVCTVIDFPLGAGGLETKTAQADLAITQGADELDFVVNLNLVKSHKWQELTAELTAIQKSVNEASAFITADVSEKRRPILTKLIIEACYLNDEEIKQTCLCAKDAGFDYVKTSTGFAILKDADGKLLPNGATVHDVALMRETVGPKMGVKASGGVHTTKEALDLIAAGASRIGASAGIKIVDELVEN